MTEHTPDLALQLRAQDDPATRRAYIQKWIARNQRRMAAGLGSAILTLPMLAQAQAADQVNALDVSGVRSAAMNADGSASLTLTNGTVVNVGAASVQVAADGTILISSAAAELVAEIVATAGATAGITGGAGIAAAGIGAVAAGVAAASGGGGSSAPEPAPVFLTDGALNGTTPLTARDVFSSFPDLEEGDRVFLSLGDLEAEVMIGTDGQIIFPEGLDLSGVQGEQTLSYRVERTTTVEREDEDGNPISETVTEEVASGSADVVIDTVPPVVTIDTPIAGDGILNAAEQGDDLEISGTAAGAEDGQIVTVCFNGQDYTATVTQGAWSLTIPAADLAGLADGASLEITADVSDVAGNSAVQATTPLATDFTAGITIDPVSIETLNTFTGVTIEGASTGVEEGRAVTLSFNGTEYSGTVGADGRWSVDIPPAVIDALADGAEVAISAAVSDVAGNPASATANATTDFSAPALVITSPESGGFINAAMAGDDIVVSGSALAGQEVTVLLNGTEETVTADADNRWSVTFDADALPEADGPVTITATTTIEGTVINAPTVTLVLDTTAPVLSINPVSGDNVLNADEQGEALTISGTATGAENGQVVTVRFNGQDYTTAVEAAAWSLTIPAADLDGLASGAALAITANVADLAGNPAAKVTTTLDTDFVAEITIAPVSIETLNTFTGVTLTGSTEGVEADQSIVINFAGQEFPTTVRADGTWSVDIPAETIAALEDGEEVAISAAVTDLAGNEAAATRDTSPDFSQPALAITSPASGGFINAAMAGDDIVVSGSALAGQEVTVLLNGTEETVTADADNRWSVTFDADALPDADGPVTITATTTIEGTVINAPTVTLVLDTTAPTLTLNSATSGTGLVLSGTTDTDVAEIALVVGGESFTATATGGTWLLTIPTADLPDVAAGATVSVTANARDLAGNAAAQAALDLTAAGITITAPADGFVLGLDAFEDGVTISGTTTGVAEGSLVTITILESPDDEDGFMETAVVGADGSWSLEIPAETVQTAADLTDFMVTASATGASYPSRAEASIDISTNFPPEITVNPVGEDGVLIIGEVGNTLEVSGSTRGVQAGEEVTILDEDGEVIGTAIVGADGTWSTSVPISQGAAGDVLTGTFVVTTEAGREASFTGQALWYAPSVFLPVYAGGSGDTLDLFIFTDLDNLSSGRFTSFRMDITYDTDAITLVPATLEDVEGQLIATGGLHSGVAIGERSPNEGADGQVTVFGLRLLGQFNATNLENEPIYVFQVRDIDSTQVIEISLSNVAVDGAQVGNSVLFLGTTASDTISADSVDSVIRGLEGDDQIDLSAVGVHTVIFEAGSVDNGFDTITGFTLGGALADRFAIAFDRFGPDEMRGEGTDFQLSSGGAVGADVGLLVFTTAVADFDAATINAALTSLTGLEAGDGFYLLIGDGTDAELTAAEFNGTELIVGTSSGTSYARFEDIGDLAGFSAANVVGFAPLAEV